MSSQGDFPCDSINLPGIGCGAGVWVGTDWLVIAPTGYRNIPQPAEISWGLATGISICGAFPILTTLRKVIQKSPIDDVTQLAGDGNVPPPQ